MFYNLHKKHVIYTENRATGIKYAPHEKKTVCLFNSDAKIKVFISFYY
jgi:hypothetical protein